MRSRSSLRHSGLIVAACLLTTLAARSQEDLPPVPPLSGAIYLDVWQLEKEFVVSPLALQTWLELDLTAESTLDLAQREALKPAIGDFFATRCPVTIAEQPVDFVLDRILFIQPNPADFIPIEPDAAVPVQDVMISVVFAAPNADLKGPVQVLWNLFPIGEPTVPVKVADIAGTRVFNVKKLTPHLSFHGRYLRGARDVPKAPPAPARATLAVPWLTIALILCAIPVILRIVHSEKPGVFAIVVLLSLAGGAAAARKFATFEIARPFSKNAVIAPAESSEILDRLLRGVYHAFDYRDQSKQYDVLAEAVGGDALTDIFLEVRRTLENRQRDGSRVRVKDISVEESNPTPLDGRRGFQAECDWEVSGRVGHWGHFHDRTNRYRATFVIEPIDGSWKITDLTLHARDREVEPTP